MPNYMIILATINTSLQPIQTAVMILLAIPYAPKMVNLKWLFLEIAKAVLSQSRLIKIKRTLPLDDKVLFLYAQGTTTQKIVNTFKELYGADASPSLYLTGSYTEWLTASILLPTRSSTLFNSPVNPQHNSIGLIKLTKQPLLITIELLAP